MDHIFAYGQRTKRLFEHLCSGVGKEYGLSQNDMAVLLFLTNNKPLDTANDIVKYRGISKSWVCKSVDELTNRGYLLTEQDKADRRRIHLRVNPSAEKIICRLQDAKAQFFEIIFKDFTADDRVEFGRLLDKIMENTKEGLEQWQ